MISPAPLLLAREIWPNISHLRWAIGGSLLLHRLGLNAEPQDLDIVSTLDDFEEINLRLASAFGSPRHDPHPSYTSIRFSSFQSRPDVKLDVMAGVRVRSPEGKVTEWHFDPETIFYHAGLPWMRATDWVELYEMFDRPESVRMLKQFIAANPRGGE